jgi:hypothetical protein
MKSAPSSIGAITPLAGIGSSARLMPPIRIVDSRSA